MNAVWSRGSATGRDVCDDLSAERPVAYTTVVTLMNILVAKGRLVRERAGRGYAYRPKETKERVQRSLVRDFVDRVFAGSPRALLAHLVGENKISADDVRELLRESDGRRGRARR